MAQVDREVVGVFGDVNALECAAQDLMSAGFDRNLLSLLATDAAVKAHYKGRMVRVEQLEDDPTAPRIAYVDRDTLGVGQGALVGGLFYLGAAVATGAVLVSGGALLPALGAAIAGGVGGGALGGVLAARLGAETGAKIDQEVHRGGLILWVRTNSDDEDARAIKIMTDCGGTHVHAHGAPAAAATAGVAAAVPA